MVLKVWLGLFFGLFALVELYRWLESLSLSMPAYVLAGGGLAVLSNPQVRSYLWHQVKPPQITGRPPEQD